MPAELASAAPPARGAAGTTAAHSLQFSLEVVEQEPLQPAVLAVEVHAQLELLRSHLEPLLSPRGPFHRRVSRNRRVRGCGTRVLPTLWEPSQAFVGLVLGAVAQCRRRGWSTSPAGAAAEFAMPPSARTRVAYLTSPPCLPLPAPTRSSGATCASSTTCYWRRRARWTAWCWPAS